MTNSYFVMQKEKPRLSKLRNLLEMNFYCGKALDDNSDAVRVNLIMEVLIFSHFILTIYFYNQVQD
jgi:hypothetical protein